MKRLFVLCVAAVLAMGLLAACGASNANVGTYKAESVMGMTLENWGELTGTGDAEKVAGQFVVELKTDGKATLTVASDTQDVDYKVEGEKITLSSGDKTYEGTIKDNKIVLNLDGIELVLVKQQ